VVHRQRFPQEPTQPEFYLFRKPQFASYELMIQDSVTAKPNFRMYLLTQLLNAECKLGLLICYNIIRSRVFGSKALPPFELREPKHPASLLNRSPEANSIYN